MRENKATKDVLKNIQISGDYIYLRSEYHYENIPYELKIYKNINTQKEIKIKRYYRTDDPKYRDFLFKVIKDGKNLPEFIINNIEKIKKIINEEIKRRKELNHLSGEYKKCFIKFFGDTKFFDNYDDEFYQIKIDILCIDYLDMLLNTNYYNIVCDKLNQKESEILSKIKIVEN